MSTKLAKDPTIALFNLAWDASFGWKHTVPMRILKRLLFGKRKRSRHNRMSAPRLANPNFRPENNANTPLTLFAGNALHPRATKLLLRAGALPDYHPPERPGEWLSALANTVEYIEAHSAKNPHDLKRRLHCARLLLEHGARTDAYVTLAGDTVRGWARLLNRTYPAFQALLNEFSDQ